MVNPVASLTGNPVPLLGFQGCECTPVEGGVEDAAFFCSQVVLLRGAEWSVIRV